LLFFFLGELAIELVNQSISQRGQMNTRTHTSETTASHGQNR